MSLSKVSSLFFLLLRERARKARISPCSPRCPKTHSLSLLNAVAAVGYKGKGRQRWVEKLGK